MNIPGAEGTQARHWTDAAAEGKQKDVMQVRPSLSTSRMPLWRLDTVVQVKHQRLTCYIFSLVIIMSELLTSSRLNVYVDIHQVKGAFHETIEGKG